MPFLPSDAAKHTKKAKTLQQQTQWAKVANSARAACMKNGGDETKCDAKAVRQANGVIAKNMEEKAMPDIRQIAESAIEVGLATLTGETKTNEVERLRLLEKLQGELGELGAVDAGRVDTQELYDIPVFAPTAMTFADMAAADEANETADNIRELARRFQRLFDNVMFSEEIDDKMGAVRGLVDELAALMGETPTPPVEIPPIEAEPPIDQMGELHADGVAVEVARDATEADLSEAGIQAAIETGRRAPVFVDFGIMEPGPGNKRDNRYYPADVVERDIHVFEGSTIFATDHKKKERNERTKVGKLLQCPTRFLGDGTPVGRALIYDPYQAEKVRNRADAGALDTLACSIYGKGRAKKGKVDGKTYSIVEAITDGVYLELVSEAGAGGKALNLAESQTIGGETMSDNEGKTKPAPVDDTEVKEVEIQEDKGEAEPKADETPVMLEKEVVDAALAEVKLPQFVKTALSVGLYADDSAFQEAIDTAIAEVKKLTGSGQVVGLGESEAPEAETQLAEKANERHDERISAVFAEVGLGV